MTLRQATPLFGRERSADERTLSPVQAKGCGPPGAASRAAEDVWENGWWT